MLLLYNVTLYVNICKDITSEILCRMYFINIFLHKIGIFTAKIHMFPGVSLK